MSRMMPLKELSEYREPSPADLDMSLSLINLYFLNLKNMLILAMLNRLSNHVNKM